MTWKSFFRSPTRFPFFITGQFSSPIHRKKFAMTSVSKTPIWGKDKYVRSQRYSQLLRQEPYSARCLPGFARGRDGLSPGEEWRRQIHNIKEHYECRETAAGQHSIP